MHALRFQTFFYRLTSLSLFILVFAWLTPSIHAAQPTQTFTLIELTDMALQQNPATRVAWADVKHQTALLGMAKSAYWPQINAELLADYFMLRSAANGNSTLVIEGIPNTDTLVITTPGKSNHQDILTYSPGISLNYLLLDFGTRKAAVKAADYQLAASLFTQNAIVQQVILQVETAYYQVLGQQALLHAHRENLAAAKTSLEAAEALHQQGLVTIGDVYQAKSALAQAELRLQETTGALAIAKGQLAYTVGLPVQTTLALPAIPKKIQTDPISQTIDHLLTLAKQQRPDLRALEAQMRAALATADSVAAQAWPTLNLGATASKNYPSNGPQSTEANILLSVNIPIFTGFLQTTQEQAAIAQWQKAKASHDTLSNDVELQVWQAYYALETAQKAIKSTQLLLDSSVEAANQTYGQYRAGVGNILSVLATQTTQANARVQAIQAYLDWHIALAQLSKALGSLIPSTAKGLPR